MYLSVSSHAQQGVIFLWNTLRDSRAPDISFSLLPSDNFHNFAGHIVNLFEQLTLNLSPRTVDAIEAHFSDWRSVDPDSDLLV